MGVFEDFLVKAKAAAGALTEKAGQCVDVSKLNIKVAELKGDLKSELEGLGKTIYEMQKSGSDNKAAVNAAVAQIDNIKIQIEELKKQIAAIKNKILCKSCGHQNGVDALYCAKCGVKLSEVKAQTNTDAEHDDFAEFDI